MQPSYPGWSAREFMDHLVGLMPLWESEDGRMLFDETDGDGGGAGNSTGRIVVFRLNPDGSCGERVVITKGGESHAEENEENALWPAVSESPEDLDMPAILLCGDGSLKFLDRMTKTQREDLESATNPFSARAE